MKKNTFFCSVTVGWNGSCKTFHICLYQCSNTMLVKWYIPIHLFSSHSSSCPSLTASLVEHLPLPRRILVWSRLKLGLVPTVVHSHSHFILLVLSSLGLAFMPGHLLAITFAILRSKLKPLLRKSFISLILTGQTLLTGLHETVVKMLMFSNLGTFA